MEILTQDIQQGDGFRVHVNINQEGPVARVVKHALLKNDAYSKPIVAAVNGDCI